MRGLRGDPSVRLVLADFALWAAVRWDAKALGAMVLAFVLERCLSGLAIASFPLAKDTGLAHTFAAASDKKRVRGILGAASAGLALGLALWGGLAGAAMVLAAGLALWRYYQWRKSSSGASPGTWPGGSSSGRSCGCWRPWRRSS